MKTVFIAVVLLFAQLREITAAGSDVNVARYNLVWDSPSQDASGSMPIGNGEVGLNVWMEPDGDLVFYVARTDAWSECSRLLKLGRVRVRLTPNPLAGGQTFRQELKLLGGEVVIQAGDMTLQVFVDAEAPVIYVNGTGRTPRLITATLESWRNETHVLTGEELESSWTMHAAPVGIRVWESADVFASSSDTLTWYHRNEYSVVPLTLKHQGMASLANLVSDPLLHRTFGGSMTGAGFVSEDNYNLKTSQPVKKFSLAISTHTAQTGSAGEWQNQIARPVSAAIAIRRTAVWWRNFWNRSWIMVEDDQTRLPDRKAPKPLEGHSTGSDSGIASRVTQAYILQRWMNACGGRGHYPIKFNGSIFTVDPKFAGGPDFNADWRKWGDCYWWQNTRLPYFAMIVRGDFDELDALFQFYRNALPLCEARVKLYHGVQGAYFPETMTIFGAYANYDYGWDRKNRQPNEVLNPWWQYAWQQGLELTQLMIEYYEYTGDKKFLKNELIPMAHTVLSYYESKFKREADGKLIISPTQAVETYWYGVTNDTPSVAGLHAVLDGLLAIKSPETLSAREFWERMKAATPQLPIRDGQVLPAAEFSSRRSNVENPELYALWPFELFGVGRPDLGVGIETFRHRQEKASIGWQYDGQCAALVGLTSEAKEILIGKVGNSNPRFRFPVMWGPNYDWLPDQDHGSNIMLTLQQMVMATAGDQIFLLPAWPKEWDVRFKLHAPKNTTLEGVYQGGKLKELKVSPESRRKDVCFSQKI